MMAGFRPLDRLVEEELGMVDDEPDPFDPRSPVDPDLASAEEVIGAAGGRDPFRMHREKEQIKLCDPCNCKGMDYF